MDPYPTVLKSPNDPNNYRHIILPNKIQIFLISNSKPVVPSIPDYDQKKDLKSNFYSFSSFEQKPAPKPSLDAPDSEPPSDTNSSFSDEELKSEEEDSHSSPNSTPSSQPKPQIQPQTQHQPQPQPQLQPQAQPQPQTQNQPQPQTQPQTQLGISSVVISIGTGSANETKNFNGLAHLLEHVIFLGSKEFPEQEAFSQFVSAHGGSDNGRTSLDFTVYEFGVENDYLEEALYRFSRLLKEPLIPVEGIEKELNSLDNEFELSLTHDGSRNFQILLNDSDENCKYRSFSWGNKKSLNYPPHILREEILRYFKNYYTNDRIKICVYSTLSLDEMQKKVEKSFNDINNFRENENNIINNVSHLRKEAYSGHFFVESTKKEQLLIISFLLRPLFEYYRSKPLSVISNLLNEEGPGSLHYYLKKNGYINSFYAYLDDDDCSNELFFLFTIEIDLTDKGLKDYKIVINEVNRYLNLIKSYQKAPEYYLNQLKTLCNLDFLYSDDEHPSCMADKICYLMNFVQSPEQIILVYSSLYLDWNEEIYSEILENLDISQSRITILTPEDQMPKGINLDLKENWFGTKYKKNDLKEIVDYLNKQKILEDSENSNQIEFEEVNGEAEHPSNKYCLPRRNLYIPNSTSVLPDPIEKNSIPKLLMSIKKDSEPMIKMWHYFDMEEKKPKVCIDMIVLYKGIEESLNDQVDLDFFVEYFRDVFNETIGYESSEADICVSVSNFQGKGISMSFYSYSEHINLFLNNFYALFLKVCLDKKRNDLFQQIKERVIKNLKSFRLDSENQLDECLNNVLFPEFQTTEKIIDFLEKYQIEKLERFCENFLISFTNILSFTFYFHGNIYEEQSKEVASRIIDLFKEKLTKNLVLKGLNLNEFLCKKVMIFPPKKRLFNLISLKSNDIDNPNFMMLKLIDIGTYNIEERNKLTVLNSLISPQVYEVLRMQKSIGYMASSSIYDVRNRLFLLIGVNSSKFQTNLLRDEINKFLDFFLKDYLENLTDEYFKNLVDGIIANKLTKTKSLKNNANKFWSEIILDEFIFDRVERNVEILKKFEKKEIIDWIREKLGKLDCHMDFGLIPEKEVNDNLAQDEILYHNLVENERKIYWECFEFMNDEQKFYLIE